MKGRIKPNYAATDNKTNPVLIEAGRLMRAYARATGVRVCITEHSSLPIPEMFEEFSPGKSICLFCTRYGKKRDESRGQDLCDHPCRELHSSSVREAHRFGGSFAYTCELGLSFWTSPIYANKNFIGALHGMFCPEAEVDKIVARMKRLSGGAAPEAELREMLGPITSGDPGKANALAELLLVCAEYLSSGSEDCYEAMRRRARQQAEISMKIEELKRAYPSDEKSPEYPMDKERKLLDALKRGDTQVCRETLNEILAFLIVANSDQFKHIQFRAIELAVLLSRTDIGPRIASEAVLETNNRYIKIIQDAQTIEELSDALYQIVDYMAGQIFSFQGVRHASALKKAEYFIMENFTRKVSLKAIADASGLSPPYFSTIFKEEMGENLSSYLNRLRVEKASYMLTETNHSLFEIAKSCGFEDQSWFSKIFKLFTGMSPGKYRSQGGKPMSKISDPGNGSFLKPPEF